MEWKSEKLCSFAGDYDLLVERYKHGYHCNQQSESWKWRVIRSGVVISQGSAEDEIAAQKLAESNIPLNQ